MAGLSAIPSAAPPRLVGGTVPAGAFTTLPPRRLP